MNRRHQLSALLIFYSTCLCPLWLQAQSQEVWMTVFVHGIMSIKPHLSVANFIRFMTDQVEDCVYSRTVELMRKDSIFYQNQAMQELGLKPINTTVAKGNAPGALAVAFETMSHLAFAYDTPPINYYYTFGWSGLLSPRQRVKDAKHLYTDLLTECAKFKKQGITPKIRLIGYSHGGNVLLNLALVHRNHPELDNLVIDELVLLGMPVQRETDYLINDDMFKAIYHIYSKADRIQKLDFFSLNRFFSGRLFEPRKGFTLPDKLIQIQLVCTRINRWYHNNSQQYSFRSKGITSGNSHIFRNASPGHAELWFFGWTPQHYRQTFPLNPLPAAALIPLIVKEAQDFQERAWYDRPTLMDIRPEHEMMIIKNQASREVLRVFRFLPLSEMKLLHNKVLAYKPEEYTEELYDAAIKRAYMTAFDEYKQGRLDKRCKRKERVRERRRQRRLKRHAIS